MELPIKYKLENGYIWAVMGSKETWAKCFWTYGDTKVAVLNQAFGSNPDIYKQFGMKGHNGFDLYAKDNTCLYSPLDSKVTEVQLDPNGYGNHLRLVQDGNEHVFGHLASVFVKVGDTVKEGQLVALTDNTGFSTGSHLHWGKRLLDKSGSVLNYNNGFFGYVDFSNEVSFVVQETSDLQKLQDYATAKGSRYGYYFGWGGSDRLVAACKTLGIVGRITQSQYYQFILFNK